MGTTQVLKIIFLILFVLLVSVILVCGMLLGKKKDINIANKRIRLLMRIRIYFFLAILILMLLIIVIK